MQLNNLVKFSQYVEQQLKRPNNSLQFREAILSIVEDMGFSDYDLASINNEGSKGEQIEFAFSTIPQDLSSNYSNNGLGKFDMMIEYLKENTDPIFQRTIDNYVFSAPFVTERLANNIRIFELVNDYKFHDSITIPVLFNQTSNIVKGYLTVCKKGENSKAFQVRSLSLWAQLQYLANLTCRIGFNRFPKKFTTCLFEGALSNRELEVLQLLAEKGNTYKKAATILDISTRTVEKHAERIKNKLDVNNINDAILKGLKLKII